MNHFNQFTSVTINFNLLPGVAIGDATAFISQAAAEVQAAHPGLQGTFQGEAQVFSQMLASLPWLLIGALFVMYVILGILYGSYIHPITVLLPAVVPAVVGGLATLWLFGAPLSLYSIIGLFLLLGMVKKNGIMIVDFALQRIDEGLDLRAAIHEASLERFRPIMMTTLAALMGAVPIALGFGADGSSRQPLGLVIVGGLIFSAARHPIRHTRDLSLDGMVPGARARSRAHPPQFASTRCGRNSANTSARQLIFR